MLNHFEGVVVFLILRYLAYIYESTAIALLGYVQAVLLVLSFLWQLYFRGQLRIRIRFPFAMLEKNLTTHLQIRVENDRILRLPKLSFLVSYHNAGEKKKHRERLSAYEVPSGVCDYQYAFRIRQAGNYAFRIQRLRVYDIFGIFYQDYRIGREEYVLVLPEIKEMPITLGQRVTHFFGDSDEYDKKKPGNDPGEIFDVREYRAGDRLSGIHWKLSAKLDQTMIRENSLPKACPVILLVNEEEFLAETVLETAVGLSFSLMGRSCAHFLAWKNRGLNDFVRCRVEDEESFYEAVMTYLQDREHLKADNIVWEYRERYASEQYVHSLVLEGGKLIVDGDIYEEDEHFYLLLS